MRELYRIPLPWTPYTVAFSHSGDYLIAAGGTWYGGGSLLVLCIRSGDMWSAQLTAEPSGEAAVISKEGPPKMRSQHWGPTVSGVCIDASERYVVASTWTARHHYGPTYILGFDHGKLAHRATLSHQWIDPIGDPCPTGALLFNQRIIVRSNTSKLEDVFAVVTPPDGILIETNGIPRHLTSSRLAIARGMLITGGGGSGMVAWRRDMGTIEDGKACSGLAILDFGQSVEKTRVIQVTSCSTVTAISADQGGDTFVTGGLDGEVDRWAWNGFWTQHRLQGAYEGEKPRSPNVSSWVAYKPSSIVGTCHMAEAGRWLTVDAGGEVGLWATDECHTVWSVPHAGSPRSIASHPSKPWFAVAVKAGFLGEDSAVIVAAAD